jgi:hypothetical protein
MGQTKLLSEILRPCRPNATDRYTASVILRLRTARNIYQQAHTIKGFRGIGQINIDHEIYATQEP